MENFYKKIPVLAMLALASQAHAGDFLPESVHLYGYKNANLYEIKATGASLKWNDSHFFDTFTEMTSGWTHGGKLCGYSIDAWGTTVYGAEYVEINLTDGTTVSSTAIGTNLYMDFAALNEEDGNIYGYGFDASGKRSFLKAPSSNPGDITVVRNVENNEYCYGMTWDSSDKYIVGMRPDGTLVSIDADGAQTPIVMTGVKTSYSSETAPTSAIAYCENENLYYWSVQLNSYDNKIYAIDPKLKTVEDVGITDDRLYRFLLCECDHIATAVPNAPEITVVGFSDGALFGTFTLTMPTQNETGTEIVGNLLWTVTLDSDVYATGTSQPGATVEVPFTTLSEGLHTFGFSVASGDNKSQEATRRMYVGVDTPATPENVTLTGSEVKWDAVTGGANGGYVDLATLKYEVYLEGTLVGTTDQTNMIVEVPQDGDLRLINVAVKAVSGGKTSDAGVSNKVFAGNAMPLPMTITPTLEESELCIYIDGNDDGRDWTFNSGKGCFSSGYNETKALNDWLILPPVELEQGNLYEFSMDVWRQGNFFSDEYIEVCYGTAPTAEAMTNVLIARMQAPAEDEMESVENVLRVVQSGRWYVGIHSLSEPDQFGVNVKNIKLSLTDVHQDSPESVANLSAEAATAGELKATVRFTMPSKLVDGTEIAAGTMVSAIVQGASEVTVEAEAGNEAEAVVATIQGNNTITVIPMIGARVGQKTTINVFTGETIPGTVSNLKANVAENMLTAKLTWDAPEAGVEGGYINPENVKYNVYVLKSTSVGDIWDVVATDIKDTEYTFVPDQLMQDYFELSVRACNVAGETPTAVKTDCVLGMPHSLPMEDDFYSGTYTFNPWVVYMPNSEYNTQWGLLPLSVIPFLTGENDNAICGMGLVDGCKGKAGMPIFKTSDKVHAQFEFWTGESAASNITVTGKCYGMNEEITVVTVEPNGAWTTIDVNLPEEFAGKDWVQLFINADFPNGSSDWVILKAYNIADGEADSLNDVYASDDLSIIPTANGIKVISASETAINVFAADGKHVISQQLTPGETNIPLTGGIYVVTCGGKTLKVFVK